MCLSLNNRKTYGVGSDRVEERVNGGSQKIESRQKLGKHCE